MTVVREVAATDVVALAPQLRGLLVDSVAHGASVGFLDPLDRVQADAY